MTPVTWVSSRRGLYAACDLGIRQVRSPCRLCLGLQARRDFHAVYDLVFGQGACDLSIRQTRSSCCLCLGFQAKRDLHAVYGLGFRQSAFL
jgi:hypothetical protein